MLSSTMLSNKKITLFLLLLGLAVQPFVFWPKAAVTYELPRVWFIRRWIEVLALMGVFKIFKDGNGKNLDSRLFAGILGFFISAIMVSFFGGHWVRSFWGNYYRGDGLWILGHFVILWLVLVLAGEKSWQKTIMTTIGAGSLGVGIWAIIEDIRLLVLHQGVPNWQGIVGVSFNQPVFLAGYLTVCLPFLADLITRAKNKFGRWFWTFGLMMQILAIILTRAWGGILGITVFLIGWFLVVKNKSKYLIGLAGLILIILMGGLIWRVEDYVESHSWALRPEARERIAIRGLLAWQKRPIVGWGWSNFDSAFQAVDWPEKYKTDIYVDKAHSSLLEVLVTTGIIGFGFYLLIIVRTLKILKQPYLLLALVLWLVHSQTNVISISEELIFWVILGMAV